MEEKAELKCKSERRRAEAEYLAKARALADLRTLPEDLLQYRDALQKLGKVEEAIEDAQLGAAGLAALSWVGLAFYFGQHDTLYILGLGLALWLGGGILAMLLGQILALLMPTKVSSFLAFLLVFGLVGGFYFDALGWFSWGVAGLGIGAYWPIFIKKRVSDRDALEVLGYSLQSLDAIRGLPELSAKTRPWVQSALNAIREIHHLLYEQNPTCQLNEERIWLTAERAFGALLKRAPAIDRMLEREVESEAAEKALQSLEDGAQALAQTANAMVELAALESREATKALEDQCEALEFLSEAYNELERDIS